MPPPSPHLRGVVVLSQVALSTQEGEGATPLLLLTASSAALHRRLQLHPWPTAPRSRRWWSVVLGALRTTFLPPGALPAEYTHFQMLDALQGSCSYLRGVLALHSTLEGAGLGGPAAAASSAVLTFVLKDGASHIGSLVFGTLFAAGFDGELKFWRLFADVINDVGLTLELAAPLFGPAAFLPVTCVANVCRALCGVAAGATRVAISSHFAAVVGGGGSQIALLQAKEGAQETAVTLMGLLLGLLLSSSLNASPVAKWGAFVVLTAVHIWANYVAVSLLQLRSLNPARAGLLCVAFLQQQRREQGWISGDLHSQPLAADSVFGTRSDGGGGAGQPRVRRRATSRSVAAPATTVRGRGAARHAPPRPCLLLPTPAAVAAVEPVFPPHFKFPMWASRFPAALCRPVLLRYGAPWGDTDVESVLAVTGNGAGGNALHVSYFSAVACGDDSSGEASSLWSGLLVVPTLCGGGALSLAMCPLGEPSPRARLLVCLAAHVLGMEPVVAAEEGVTTCNGGRSAASRVLRALTFCAGDGVLEAFEAALTAAGWSHEFAVVDEGFRLRWGPGPPAGEL